MKKTIKIFFAVFMSALIICFSCLTAFADTTVDNSYLTTDWLKNNVLTCSGFNLENLVVDDYLVLALKSHNDSLNADSVRLIFIPKSARNFVNLGHLDSVYDGEMSNNCIYYYHTGSNDNNSYLHIQFLGVSYTCVKNPDGSLTPFISVYNNNGGKYSKYAVFKDSMSTTEYFVCNNSDIVNFAVQQSGFQLVHRNMTTSKVATIYNRNLFKQVTEIYPGYKGAVYDNSLEEIFKNNGKTADDTIVDKYKYQIYYSLNNDLRMVFLNNAYQPEYKKDKYIGTNSDEAYKYKFHYNKTSDCIVYYPTFNMYLSYDDWYKFQPEDNTFKWWWEEDTKDFTLISDWKYSNGTYTGTRVATNWEKLNQLGESADFTAISSFITDKDKLLDNGWKNGRPSDTNYPYCIEVDYNGTPGLYIYSNSMPKISKINIISDTHKEFDIYMVGMYGYVYNAINDCYINYDFTIKDGKKNFVQQYLFKYFSYELHCLDSKLNLTLFENYKGTDTDYKGTRVFFNWDITQDKRIGMSDDEMRKLEDNCKEDIGAFTDSNGNKHGGDLNNYSDEDKNKYNESGSNSNSTTDNNFDFSFDGIMNYCDSFFSFIQSAFSVFPASIWVLISLSIAMLVFLRVLGR